MLTNVSNKFYLRLPKLNTLKLDDIDRCRDIEARRFHASGRNHNRIELDDRFDAIALLRVVGAG